MLPKTNSKSSTTTKNSSKSLSKTNSPPNKPNKITSKPASKPVLSSKTSKKTTTSLPSPKILPTPASKNYLPEELKNIDDILAKYARQKNYKFSSAPEKGRTFEQYTGEVLRCNGYKIEKFTTVSGDNGVDIVVSKKNTGIFDDEITKYAVQCKYFTTQNVGNKAVLHLHGGNDLRQYKCNKAMIITTTGFTPAAKKVAKEMGVLLIDGKKFSKMMKKYKG